MFGIPKAFELVQDSRPQVLAGRGWMRRDEAIMGTAISVELWSDDALGGESAIDAVMQEMHRIDRTMSPHKPDSEQQQEHDFSNLLQELGYALRRQDGRMVEHVECELRRMYRDRRQQKRRR